MISATDCLANTGVESDNLVVLIALAVLFVVGGVIALKRSGRVLVVALALAVSGSLAATAPSPSFASVSCDSQSQDSGNGDEEPGPNAYDVTVTINSIDTLIGSVAELGYTTPEGGFSGWLTMNPSSTEVHTIGDVVDPQVQFSISVPGNGGSWDGYTITADGGVSVSYAACGTVNGVGYVDNQGCNIRFDVTGPGTITITYIDQT